MVNKEAFVLFVCVFLFCFFFFPCFFSSNVPSGFVLFCFSVFLHMVFNVSCSLDQIYLHIFFLLLLVFLLF